MNPLPTLTHGPLRLEPLADQHRELLRAACDGDEETWRFFPYSLAGHHFDAFWRTLGADGWQRWAILDGDALQGMTGILAREPRNFELGSTYYRPAARGTGMNRALKWLLLSHLFATGTRRMEFRVDARNARSRAAVLKLGATEEGTLRRHRETWTGFVRDTVVFSILDHEWPALEPALRPS